MLNKDALSQLSQLKTTIQAEKEYAEGTVAGTNGRFGFVRLDDGRDAFLAPDKMQHVLPGDRVQVSLKPNSKGKLDADLEKLVTTDKAPFTATYRMKGKAHFVEPEAAHLTRWLFVPPKERGKIQEGDVVVARLTHHPYRDGKASVAIEDVIGQRDQPKFEFKYVVAKHKLNRQWDKEAEQQAQKLTQISVASTDQRDDLQELVFVTIDGRTTRDMDDALAIDTTDEGWRLNVAIADPASYIEPESPLAKAAKGFVQTLYMPGGQLPMLPQNLATDIFSLVEDAPRPALVCTVDVKRDGSLGDYAFKHAVIRSRAKLCYTDVAATLSGEDVSVIPEEFHPLLKELEALSQARLNYRQTHSLVGESQDDFDFVLDENGKVADIVRREKTSAHRLVEEAMLMANICAGNLLAEHQQGLLTAHRGFREDRIGEVRALLKEEMPERDTTAINELGGHLELVKFLESDEQRKVLLGPLRRMMRGSELSLDVAPHMGMGLESYATITSPIRRFADLYNHWAIRGILYGDSQPKLSDNELEALREMLNQGRQAGRELEQWLVCQYLQKQKSMQGPARIRIVTQKGFGARFQHNGIDGFVAFDKKTEKSFDAKRMALTVGDTTYRIGDCLELKLVGVDLDKKRVKFALADA